MAVLSFSLLILATLAGINANSCDQRGALPRMPGILDIVNRLTSLPDGNELQSAIELVRDYLKTTVLPEIGSLDPLYVETSRFQQDDDEMNADVTVSATTIKGLLDFEVTDIKASLNSQRFQVDFLFPEISASGKYNLLYTPALQRFQIFGNGEFDLTATNLRVQLNVDVGYTIEEEAYIKKLESELSLEAGDFKITGLLDNELVSEIVSWRVSKYMVEIVPEMKSDVDELLKQYVEEIKKELSQRGP